MKYLLQETVNVRFACYQVDKKLYVNHHQVLSVSGHEVKQSNCQHDL